MTARRWLSRLLASFSISALVVFIASALPSCALFVSFGDDDSSGLYGVSGSVDGLDGSSTLTLTLNGGSPLQVSNGHFDFPAVVPDGPYVVTVREAQGHICSTERGEGVVAGAAITDVVVHCSSTDAALQDLRLSGAPIVPAFSSATLAYTAGPTKMDAIFAVPTTTVSATSRSRSARITVNGAAVSSGSPSAPIALASGPNPIDVTVTAGDGKTRVHYALVVSAYSGDYIKASNTRVEALFGRSIALSGDTLAVGSPGEMSNGKLVDSNENDASLTDAGAVYVYTRTAGAWTKQAYIKASNTFPGTLFGASVALSGDTLAVGAYNESSNAKLVNGNENDRSLNSAGAVYIYTRTSGVWTKQAYIKASNTRMYALFGASVALSGDTLAVGSYGESSNAKLVNNNDSDTSMTNAGAVYVYTRTSGVWTMQAYIKASNTRMDALFGWAVALSGDTLAVGSYGESSNAKLVNNNDSDTSAPGAGAVYIYTRLSGVWTKQAYIKASNTRANTFFGASVALSRDGDTLAVASPDELSGATLVGGNEADTSASYSGAVYVYTRAAGVWTKQAYIKASNTRRNAQFGTAVALSDNALAVGAIGESSSAKFINGDENDVSANSAGAVYVYTRAAGVWTKQAFVKASNTREKALFGTSVALFGSTLAVGSPQESSSAILVNGNQADTLSPNSGAAYVY